jgi:proton glutamate symport protein
MSLTFQVLLALAAGFAVGLPLSRFDGPVADGVLTLLGPIGTIFVNAIRMTVIPLVVSSLIVGVTAAPDPRSVGRIGARALVIFVLLVGAAAAFGVVLGAPLMALIPLDPSSVESLRAGAVGAGASAAEGAKSIPSLGEWIVALVPSNPIKAAADGAMLPIIVVSVTFAAALMQIAPERRAAVVRPVEGLMDASLALVRAILVLAPLGVFALAVPLAATMGTDALGAILGYVVIVCGICVLFWLVVLYPLAVTVGRVPLRRFARATLPAQSIAFSSRSSLAALPALLESVRDTLRLPPVIGSFLIPLAATMFRVGAGIGQTVGVLFIARLYGVELGAMQLVTIAVISLVTSFSVPGVPGGSIIVMVPVLTSAGIPVEGVGILLGADTIPDMFRTTTNVTGHMTAAVILARGETTSDG